MSTWTMNHPPKSARMSDETLAKRRANSHRKYMLHLEPNGRADVLTRMAASETARRGRPVEADMLADGTVVFHLTF